MSNFVNIAKKDFESVIINFYNNEFHTTMIGGEYVYDFNISPDLVLRIYSSIDFKTKEGRKCGADAIRITMLWKGKPMLKKQRRVYRTLNWKKNLMARLDEVMDNFFENYRLSQFGDHLLTLRNGRFGEFWGCVDFKNGCRYTEPVKEKILRI